MVNIAVCGDIMLLEATAADVIARCASHLSLPAPAIHTFQAPIELLEQLDDKASEPLLDLIVLAPSSSMSAIQIARDARRAGYIGEIVLIEEGESHALEARRLHVSGYLVQPIEARDLEAELVELLARLAALDAESTTMRMRGGMKRVPFSQLVYVQTSNHDQVLHMRDGQTMQLRSSSQDLFDRVSDDGRFLKLGSSYIVNLDLVQSLNSNGATLTFVEGSSAAVPVRFRKAIQDALFTRAEWRKHA